MIPPYARLARREPVAAAQPHDRCYAAIVISPRCCAPAAPGPGGPQLGVPWDRWPPARCTGGPDGPQLAVLPIRAILAICAIVARAAPPQRHRRLNLRLRRTSHKAKLPVQQREVVAANRAGWGAARNLKDGEASERDPGGALLHQHPLSSPST
jgi:hypothetical protein